MTGARQTSPILQTRLSFAPWHLPRGQRLPGTAMGDIRHWLQRDEAFAAQMALRDRLIARDPDSVRAALPGSEPAQQELLDMVLDWIAGQPGYRIDGAIVTRPDGQAIRVDRGDPLAVLGRLVQQDLCLLTPQDDEHRMTAAILCFPAYWELHEKLGRPLTGIHRRVPVYDQGIARRVQRMFDGLRPGVLLERANCHPSAHWAIATPARETGPRPENGPAAPYVRLERQTLRALPRTGAVVFSIHTAILSRRALQDKDAAAIAGHFGEI